jgi:hypothetical protein
MAHFVVGLAGAALLGTQPASAQELHPSLQATLDTVQDFDAFLDMITADYSGNIERNELWRGALAGMATALGPGCEYHPPGWRDDNPDVLLAAKTEQLSATTWRLLGLHPDDPVARMHHVVGETISKDRCMAIKAALAHPTSGNTEQHLDHEVAPEVAPETAVQQKKVNEINGEPAEKTPTPQALDPMHYAGVLTLSKHNHATGASIAYVRLATIDGPDITEHSQRHTMTWLAPWLQEHAGIRGMVLDLRSCWGRSPSAAAAIADLFLQDHPHRSIVTIDLAAQNISRAQRWEAQASGTLPNIPLVVVVDRWTSDSAVALAAALHDHGRAVVIGEPTAGAMGQRVSFAGPNGGSLVLRVTRYLSPNGNELLSGIQPDIAIDFDTTDAVGTSIDLAAAMVIQRQLDRR